MADIESDPDRMCIKVRGGKGGKDRYTLLSPVLLQTLREYWRSYHPHTWLFPNMTGTGPICTTMAQRMYYNARDRAKLGRQGGIHTLVSFFPWWLATITRSRGSLPPTLRLDLVT
jgi:integrase